MIFLSIFFPLYFFTLVHKLQLSKCILRDTSYTDVSRPTFFLCNPEHPNDDVDVETSASARGTTNSRPSCKTSGRHLFWRLQDSRRVPPGVRACNKNEWNTIGEPPITPIAGRESPLLTGDSLTTHSLLTDTFATTEYFLRTRTRKREGNDQRALPTSRNSLGRFSIRPRPGQRCFLSVAGP